MGKWSKAKATVRVVKTVELPESGLSISFRHPSTRVCQILIEESDATGVDVTDTDSYTRRQWAARQAAIHAVVVNSAVDEAGEAFFDAPEEVLELPLGDYKLVLSEVLELAGMLGKVAAGKDTKGAAADKTAGEIVRDETAAAEAERLKTEFLAGAETALDGPVTTAPPASTPDNPTPEPPQGSVLSGAQSSAKSTS